MSAVIQHLPQQTDSSSQQYRRCAESTKPSILTDVYCDDTNIVIWKRQLSESLQSSVDEFVRVNDNFRLVQSVTPESANETLKKALGDKQYNHELITNITELVEMFCDLFGLKTVGLRLTTLDRAMCPKFHFDRVPCRLVTTYHGVATEWLPHNLIDRTKLNINHQTAFNDQTGLYKNQNDIQKMNTGDVALLKGELWEGNEDAGLVHRSPEVVEGENRLLLTLDFID